MKKRQNKIDKVKKKKKSEINTHHVRMILTSDLLAAYLLWLTFLSAESTTWNNK